MGIHNKIAPGYAYFLTLTIIGWIDIFSHPAYKHIMVDSLNYCIANKGLNHKLSHYWRHKGDSRKQMRLDAEFILVCREK